MDAVQSGLDCSLETVNKVEKEDSDPGVRF